MERQRPEGLRPLDGCGNCSHGVVDCETYIECMLFDGFLSDTGYVCDRYLKVDETAPHGARRAR